jgi:hypothetical protein
MKRLLPILLLATACGSDGPPPPLQYNDPTDGLLRLVRNKQSHGTVLLLDLVVGDQPLTGYSVGFDLPLDDTKVTLGAFTPGTALDPGTAPTAALAKIPTSGPLAHQLVTAQSQKATSSPSDAMLAPGTVLYTIELDLVMGTAPGVVFDGAHSAPISAGMRDRAGNTVVAAKDVSIGRLEVVP